MASGRWLLVTLSLCHVLFLVTASAILGASGGILNGPLTGLRAALALPVLATLLTFGAAAVAVTQWRRREGTRGARLRYDAVVAVALLFAWSLNQWNLLGWRM